MLTHAQIWTAIDTLAAHYDLSPSGLARKAGLDPTTFNVSKRQSADGRPRWPSTESIAKVLDATGASLDEFVALVASPVRRPLPLIGFAQAGKGDYFDDGGFPVGGGWDEIDFPAVTDEHSYALEISGDSMLPLYRDGDIIIVSPGAPVRRGDRVVVKTTDGEVMAKELRRKTAKLVELRSLNPRHKDRILALEDVDFVSRILWSSQ
ncbi:MAG: helix-turn-helix transcriptional regulator [Methylobacteriaceae bacterium]|nr:helix-turn-helix transcriptional regulator [Methylobacteriaceae bacterium]